MPITPHVLYTDKDVDAPGSIRELVGYDEYGMPIRGSVTLGLCKNCGLAEIELDWIPDCP